MVKKLEIRICTKSKCRRRGSDVSDLLDELDAANGTFVGGRKLKVVYDGCVGSCNAGSGVQVGKKKYALRYGATATKRILQLPGSVYELITDYLHRI